MKITVQQEAVAETEIIIRCADPAAEEISSLLQLVEGRQKRLPVRQADGQALLDAQEVLYGEFVGRHVFLYTDQEVFPTSVSLQDLAEQYPGFVRCSKSMVVNLQAIRKLRSELSGRILASLRNGEDILISRHYAAMLRRTLATQTGSVKK